MRAFRIIRLILKRVVWRCLIHGRIFLDCVTGSVNWGLFIDDEFYLC